MGYVDAEVGERVGGDEGGDAGCGGRWAEPLAGVDVAGGSAMGDEVMDGEEGGWVVGEEGKERGFGGCLCLSWL